MAIISLTTLTRPVCWSKQAELLLVAFLSYGQLFEPNTMQSQVATGMPGDDRAYGMQHPVCSSSWPFPQSQPTASQSNPSISGSLCESGSVFQFFSPFDEVSVALPPPAHLLSRVLPPQQPVLRVARLCKMVVRYLAGNSGSSDRAFSSPHQRQ